MVVTASFLLGTGLAFTLQMLSGVVISWLLVGGGVRTDDLYYAMADSALINLWAHLLNVVAVLCAGATIAWLRPEAPAPCALWVGGAMVVFVAAQFAVPYENPAPLWSKALALLTPVPSALAGVWFWNRREAGKQGST